jgi:hypothetical protein
LADAVFQWKKFGAAHWILSAIAASIIDQCINPVLQAVTRRGRFKFRIKLKSYLCKVLKFAEAAPLYPTVKARRAYRLCRKVKMRAQRQEEK